jgi:anthraniloyl-CoA monooxygenase
MTRADMDEVRNDFVRAATMAERAGFDLIELHCAHGYLPSAFISPLTNCCTDVYGGSLRSHALSLEIYHVRAVWPASCPISVRISANDAGDGDHAARRRAIRARAGRGWSRSSTSRRATSLRTGATGGCSDAVLRSH